MASKNSKEPQVELTPEHEKQRLEELYKEHPLTDDTTCGIGPFRANWMQTFANKKVFVILYGMLGCIYSATYAYFNGTITTLEKRFKIPSRTTGIISIGNDITALFVSVFLTYYVGNRHKPRWIAFGIYTVVLFCVLTVLPHLIYGPGDDALALTFEHGAVVDLNTTTALLNKEESKALCNPEEGVECDDADGNVVPAIVLFIANCMAGIGGPLYYTLGVSYMDDNIKKSKTPVLISFSYFFRMLGPAIGYSMASVFLKMYISPTLTPSIDIKDPRWLGAWWLGYIILGVALMIVASILGLFPKSLPRAAVRRMLKEEKNKLTEEEQEPEPELPSSIPDMLRTFRRLAMNPILMCNNLAGVFYCTGYMPYWIFMPKYIETQYRQSASFSSLITGTVGLVFSAVGVLVAGIVISKFKPRARYLAGWNVVVGFISVSGMIAYIFLGCPVNDAGGALLPSGELATSFPCNDACNCEFVKYSPVCSDDKVTYISACHAGCRQVVNINGSKTYTDCSCIRSSSTNGVSPAWLSQANYSGPSSTPAPAMGGTAVPGACPVDCLNKFYIFLAVVCLLKFSGATGKASNFLVAVRCVVEKDKPVALAFGMTLMTIFAFIPSPILFGYILDRACLVWGKTCAGTGNCWLYNGESLRYLLNLTAATFVTIGTLFDVGVWYYVKDLKIFDDYVPDKANVSSKDGENAKEKIIISEE